MIKLFKLMDYNDIFQHLSALTGFRKDDELLIRLFEEKGFIVTKSQLRSWRRKTGKPNSRPVPNCILEAFFEILFSKKIENPDFFTYLDKP